MPKNEDPINSLPEYEVRTMEDDINILEGRPTDKKPVRLELPIEKTEAPKSSPLVNHKLSSLPPKEPPPPKELPIVPEEKTEKPKFFEQFLKQPEPIIPAPQKAPLPGVEEFISEAPKPPKAEAPKPKLPPIPKIEKIKEPIKIKSPRKLDFKKIILLVFFLLAVTALGVFFYWQGVKPDDILNWPPINKTDTPATLIAVDKTKTIKIDSNDSFTELLKNEANLEQTAKTLARIIPMDSPGGKNKAVLSLSEIIKELKIAVYPYILPELKGNYTLVLYNQEKEKIIGLIFEINNPAYIKEQAKYWEQTMVEDLKNLFLFKKPGQPTTTLFKNNTYKGISMRYINFPNPDLTIDYTILNNLFILSTSKESMYNIIDRLTP